ncbi:DNA circularization protein [Chromobacterium sp. IIBBL 290-4]|uniref:DNA circularization protein n=1 Tax=Chromobacterium sp. IIBBL 290-4 TaxID=2953890 RepID=UPI0020B7DCAC|nr:DNA circularization N-terminal domain-containing protein [Chromobacterium sp. IIBBL 290-4]UTH76020.1 DNA circularization N-terminal domain-containing protein [Chromobacterium sp. IIBBL 290-4]
MFSLNLSASLGASPAPVDASFRGVRFDCLKSADSAQRDQAMHEYPYKDGADVEDLGRKARKVSLSAMFWGKDYQSRLRQFVAALDAAGPGELIHPVFGSMPQALVTDYQIHHDADAPDSCTVEVNWVEATPRNPFFAAKKTLPQVDAISSQVDKLRQIAGEAFAKAQGLVATAQGALGRVAALRQQLTATVGQLAKMANQTAAQATDLLSYPQAFVAQAGQLIHSLADWRFGIQLDIGPLPALKAAAELPSATLADWKALRRRVENLPATVRQNIGPFAAGASLSVWSDDQRRIDAMLQLHVSTQLASAAAGIFDGETRKPTLTPPALEEIAGDVRSSLQTSIDQWRAALPPEDAYPLVDGLRTLGQQVQQGAAALIAAKPPLLKRKVDAACSLRQLAHLWYGDSGRAEELLRLNPQLPQPNHLSAGTLVYGYAR